MNETNKTWEHQHRRLSVLLLLVCSFLPCMQAQNAPVQGNAPNRHRWYAGVELGTSLGVSTFTSFTSAGKAGFEGGVLGGYRLSPLLSAEAGFSLYSMRLGTSKCCSDYWLGADGVRYIAPATGMDSYSYRDIHSAVKVQQYALRLNVDMLQIVRPDWDKRWSLTFSPALYAFGTQAGKSNVTAPQCPM